jgi:menaquinone-dependent protoporphyrinogen IX oxidase
MYSGLRRPGSRLQVLVLLDTSRDYEYTDWEEVRRFAGEFLKELV